MKGIFKKGYLTLILIFSILVLTAGAVFALQSRSAKAEEVTTQDVVVSTPTDSLISLIDVDTMSLSTTIAYGHEDIYIISCEEDLAYMAYKVAAGDYAYKQGAFILDADLNLAGSLWTPIGTYANPFQGKFYGQGHIISNITINEASCDANASSAVGLFGNTDGASISDVILRGSMVYNTSRVKGALAGSITNSEIINCYDECSKVGYNGASFTLSVGTCSNSYVFRGGSYDGFTPVYTTSASINNNFNVNGANVGNVGFYAANEGSYYRGNSVWYEKNLVRVLLKTDLQLYTGYTVKNNLYQTKVPVLRSAAGESDIYWLKVGYKPYFPLTTSLQYSNALISVLTFSEGTTGSFNVYYNYGYGEGRSGYYSMLYDQTFAAFFAANPYMNIRAGYTLEGLYSSATFTEDYRMDITGSDFKKAYPVEYGMYYFNWTAKSGNSVIFKFLIAEDEAGKFDSKEELGAVIDASSFGLSGATLSDNLYADKIQLSAVGYTSGSLLSLSFNLYPGFEVKSIGTSSEEALTEQANHQATVASGIYTSFVSETGIGANYSVDSYTNNDSYNKVYADTTREGDSYNISVNNAIGNNGVVYIVIGRLEYAIDITPDIVKEASDADIGYDFALVNDDGQQTTEIYGIARIDGNILYIKRGETPSLIFNTSQDSGAVIIGIAQYSGMQTQPQALEKTNPRLGYYMTWKVQTGIVISEGVLTLRLGYLKTMVKITSIDENGTILDAESEACEGLGTSINESSKYLNYSDGYFVSMNTEDKVAVTNNGYYYGVSIKIENLTSGQVVQYTLSDGGETSTWNGSVLLQIYDGNGAVYAVTVTYAERVYDVNYEFYFEGEKQTAVTNLFGVTTLSQGLPIQTLTDLTSNTLLNIQISLTNLGKGVLYVPTVSVELVQTLKDGAGYKTSAISKIAPSNGVFAYDLTLGTYDTTVKFFFEYREVEFKIDKLQHLNISGVSTELTSGLVAINPTLSFQYNFSSQTASLTGEIGSISIHSQYYLLGWYLKNGQVVESANYANLLSNASIIADVVSVGSDNSSSNAKSFVYNGVNALVRERIVTVKTITGQVGYGQFYLSDKTTVVSEGHTLTAGQIAYGEKLSIASDSFYNLGYSFSGWSVPSNSGSIENGNYSIKEGNWYSLFRANGEVIDDNGFQNWESFSNGNGQNGEVSLTATWSIIEYVVRIDDVASTIVKIGDSISYTTDPTLRDGQAIYSIGENQVYGSVLNGYVVTEYTVKHEDAVSTNQTFAFTPENFLKIISEDRRFEINSSSDPIIITTLRQAATYKLWLDNSKEGYYTYSWNESLNNGYGGIENDQIYIYVVYGTKPENLDKALSSGALSVSRLGYNLLGWAYSDNGTQSRAFGVDNTYTSIIDEHIVPTWTLKGQTVKADATFGEDVPENKTFYLTNSHDVVFGGVSGDNVLGDVVVNQTILTNGEKLTSIGFNVTFDGKTFTHGENKINIDMFAKAGVVKVQYFINVEDTLSKLNKISYVAYSGEVTFTMAQNSIYFYDHDLHSVYNGTYEFVPATEESDGVENEFGSFLYRYDWDGSDRAAEEENLSALGSTEEYFSSFLILGTDFNAGSGKSFKMSLNQNKFGDDNFADLFDNVIKEGEGYYAVIADALTIEKAKITISFPSGSAYHFENVVTVVYENTSPSQFSVGKVTFTYNYSRILLVTGATPNLYKGQQNHLLDSASFVVEGLTVENYTQENLEKNFEWNISSQSSFNLLNSDSALKLEYAPRYLTAEGGALRNYLSEVYGSSSDKIQISNIKLDGQNQTYSGSQFSIFSGNDVVMSVAGNDSMQLFVYVNKSILSSVSLSFTLSVNFVDSHSDLLYPLAWGTSTTPSNYADAFANDGNPTLAVNPVASGVNTKTYAVLTDVVKLTLDYNGGKVNENSSETIYLSTQEGALIKDNPAHPYIGISFAGYTDPESENVTLSTEGNTTTFTSAKGGKAQTVKAKWSFDSIDATAKGKLTYYASKDGLTLSLNEIADIAMPELFSNKSYSLSSSGNIYLFNSQTSTFEIANDDGFALPSMTGQYTLTINFVFSDGISPPQSLSSNINFTLEILINTIDVNHSGDSLTFNNTDQSGSLSFDFTLNGQNDGSVAFIQMAKADSQDNLKGVYLSNAQSMKNAGDYTLTFKVSSALSEIYQFTGGGKEKSITISINKFEIVLKDYADQISLSKVFGQTEPTLQADITISSISDVVALSFTRQSGEAIGLYGLSFLDIVKDEDKVNFTVNADGFVDYFEIFVPSGNLVVELLDKLSYTYNGYALGNFTTSFNGTNYTLSASAGEENLSVNYNVYYLNGANKVQIPESERENYASIVIFSSNAELTAGYYALSASLASDTEWKGVEFANSSNAVITVNKREVTINLLEKVFDQTANFVYNNVNSDDNTATLDLLNVVSYSDGSVDEIVIEGQISSSQAGNVTITNAAITNSANDNYTLKVADDFAGVVLADNMTTIAISAEGETVFDYGLITNATTSEELIELLPLMFNGGVVGKEFISVTAAEVLESAYSTGNNLNAGNYQIKFTLSSKNYTFKAARGEVGVSYSMTGEIEIEVDPISITIANSTLKITKPYDGNATVLAKFVGQKVNFSGGYYTSSGLLSGDEIIVESGEYKDKTIGSDKEISLILSGADLGNYSVTTSGVGDITKITLIFNKNGNTLSFVDGEQDFGNSNAIKTEYTGNFEENISLLLSVDNFMTRVGYTQTGWSYDGASLLAMTTSQKEALLQAATDGGTSGVILDAIWQINNYTVTVVAGDHATSSITTATLAYYSNIDEILITVDAGYKFFGYSSSNENATLSITGGIYTRNGVIKLERLLGDITITIQTKEIEVKIILDYNPPMGLDVSTEDSSWLSLRERTIKYSELVSNDLPVLKVSKEDTFDFDFWTLDGNLSTGDNIWERINGDALNGDNLTGYTFKANWTEAELLITLNASENAIITVKDESGEEIVKGESGYTVKYLDSISVKISHNDWYKWTGLEISGDYDSISGNTSATNEKEGNFSLDTIKSNLTITVTTSAIKVTFTTSYVLPVGTEISKESGEIVGEFTADSGKTTIGDAIEKYQPTAGTYRQESWSSGETEIAFTANAAEIITSLYGSVPTKDITLSARANFAGLVYTITFFKNSDEAVFTGTDAGKDTVTRQYIYGSSITNLPVLDNSGKDYIWRSDASEIFSNGKTFVTSLANANCTLTLTADWEYIPYKVYVQLTGQSEKVESITADGLEFSEYVEVILGSNQAFQLTLATGYEIDKTSTSLVGDDETTLTFSENQVTVVNVRAETTLTIVIKAKDYTILINESGYETLTNSSFAVKFDQDISQIFANESFTRDGYILKGLNDGENVFATYSNGTWSFSEKYVQSGIYKHDASLNLDLVWEYDASAKYISATIEKVENVYYNGTAQSVADATITVASGETFVLGSVFENGEKAIEAYYMVDGVKVKASDNFECLQINVLSVENVSFNIVIEDVLTGNTYTITSMSIDVEIKASEVLIESATILSYYTGTSAIELISGASYGEIIYHDGTANNQLEIAKVEIIDESGLYSVGDGYSVKYYFNPLSGFSETNFTGLTKDGGFYTLETSEMIDGYKVTAKIRKSNATLTISGMGYESGLVHTIEGATVTFPEYVTGANAIINSIKTKEPTAKVYTLAGEFDIDVTIKNASGVDITENFNFILSGSYTIRSASYAFSVDVRSKYLTGESLSDSEIIAKVEKVEYSGQIISIASQLHYMVGDELIFSITENGSKDLSILITKGKTLNIHFSLGGEMAVVGWSDNDSHENALSLLQNLEKEGEKTYNASFSSDAMVVAILSDYKAILMELGDKGGDQGYAYFKLGSTGTLTQPEAWIGFEFAGWEEGESGLSINGNNATLPLTANITASSVKALWTIEKPKATPKTFAFDAKINGSERTVGLGDVLDGGIENYSSVLSYSYDWLLNGKSLSKENNLTIKSLTSSSGTYTLIVTAKKDGYVSESSIFEVEIIVNGLMLESVTLSETNFTYANKNFAKEIEVSFTGEDLDTLTLDTLTLASSPFIYFLQNNGVIKDAGEYNLTLVLSEEVFDLDNMSDAFVYDFTVNVEKAAIILAQEDIPADKAEKLFGMDDPDFTFTHTMFEGENAEDVTISLTRQAGESKGDYLFTSISSPSENFSLSLAAGVHFSIVEANYTLRVVIDSGLTAVYSNSKPIFETKYDESLGKWTMTLGESTSTLSLSYRNGDEYTEISGNLYVIALENVTFSLDSAIQKGVYDAANMTWSGEGNFADFEVEGKVEISSREITIVGITKTFDRNDNVIASKANLSGLIDGDDVSLSGKYAQKTVGNAILLSSLTLSGSAAANYHISAEQVYGDITPLAVTNSSFSVGVDTFDYGKIGGATPLSEILALFGTYALNIDGVTSDIADGYAQIKSISIDESLLSNAGYLIAGNVTIKVVISSTNFTGLEENYNLSLTINKLALDLSSLSFAKDYDETDALPADTATDLSVFVKAGDKVEIDLENSRFEDASISLNKKVIIVLTGDDAANYSVIDNVKGKINAYSIKLIVDVTQENESLVSGGAFVEDGQSIKLTSSSFLIGYPTEESGQDVLDSLILPTRVGYTATGWKYLEGGEYIDITSENIFTLLEKVASDASNLDRSLTIYPAWEIDYYSITVNGEHISSVTITGDYVEDGMVRYYSDANVAVTGEKGYKIKSFMLSSGSAADKNLSDVGNNSGNVTFTRVASDIVMQATMAEIEVKFTIDLNLPLYTQRIDSNNLSFTFGYPSLSSLGEGDLAQLQVTEGTYSLAGYIYDGNNIIGDKTLAEVVDALYENLESDIEISLKASWKGENYLITFDPSGGTLEGNNTISAIYGSVFAGSFPSVTKEGYSKVWLAPDGETYTESDALHSVGLYNAEDDVWTLTFTAQWTNNPYNLTIIIGEKLTVKAGGEIITSGKVYSLVYGVDSITIDVSASEGYGFNVNKDGFYGNITERKTNQFVVKDLTAHSVLNFEKTFAQNKLTLDLTLVDGFTVKIDGQDAEASSEILAPTESQVEVVLTAVKGYEFLDSMVTFTGKGNLSKTISQDKKTLTLVWSLFTGGATVTVKASAAANVITISDASDYFLTLNFNGQSVSATGGTFSAKTGETVSIEGTLKYGYCDGQVTSSVDGFVNDGSITNTFSNADKYYHFTATLDGFNEDFTLTFSASEREYTFVILVKEGMEEYGEITAVSPQTVKFGQSLILSEMELRYDFIFDGWESDGAIISKDKNASILLDESRKAFLESVNHGENITVYATYIKRTLDVQFVSGKYGQFVIMQNGNQIASVGASSSIVQEVLLGQDVVLLLKPDKGYEVDFLKLDDAIVSLEEYGYTEENKQVAIYEDLTAPIYKIEVGFKAGAREITVQAGTRIQYQEFLGTDAGGLFYQTDSQGNKLPDSAYLENEGKLIIGADYKIASLTDVRLYFTAEVRSGFTISVSCSSSSVVISQSVKNGVTVYMFSGIKEDILIKAIFIAKENKVDVHFSLAGETESAMAGIIAVDSSTNLVSASPNRGSSLSISVVTSASLSLEVYSSLAYELLADENGYLSYEIVYEGENGFDSITVGRLTPQEKVYTGFTYKSTIDIENVNANATIYIHVIPQVYSIKFASTDYSEFILENIVRYGEMFDLSTLSEEDLAKIFPTREGYTFAGYFTKPLAQGKQYISDSGQVLSIWLEDGYDFDGSKYVQDHAFDETTNTFTLYGGWIYNRAKVEIEFLPNALGENDYGYGISQAITNLDSITSWTSQYARWYAEILIGSNINLKALDFDGYEFVDWTVYFEEGEGVKHPSSFTLYNLQLGTYLLRANYNPTYALTILNQNNGKNDGGSAFLVQDGAELAGNSFDKEKIVTLKATPREGYKFLYWTDETGAKYYGTLDSSGNYSYTFSALIDTPLNLTAVFVGKPVIVNFNAVSAGEKHLIRGVFVNGNIVDYTQSFNACVGDALTVLVEKTQGYGFEFKGAVFSEFIDPETGYYTFSYNLKVQDLTIVNDDTYTINITFNATKEKLNFMFNVKVDNAVVANEVAKAGSLKFKGADGKQENVVSGQVYQLTYEDIAYLSMLSGENYRVKRIYLRNPSANDITEWKSGETLIINQNLVDRYFAREITIDVYFERMIWIMEEFISDTLEGKGTAIEPYIITTPAEFAFVAYAVNNGLVRNGLKFADANYILKADIDFKGKYWEPIGSAENPFNGTMDLGSYEIKNITLYKTYSNPRTSYGGLFWHLGERAEITQNDNTLVLVFSIIGGVILLILLVILIIYMLRKREKEKIHQAANK